eukprot:scaffold16062_cov278-Ochromonas_danica.AAC.5
MKRLIAASIDEGIDKMMKKDEEAMALMLHRTYKTFLQLKSIPSSPSSCPTGSDCYPTLT